MLPPCCHACNITSPGAGQFATSEGDWPGLALGMQSQPGRVPVVAGLYADPAGGTWPLSWSRLVACCRRIPACRRASGTLQSSCLSCSWGGSLPGCPTEGEDAKRYTAGVMLPRTAGRVAPVTEETLAGT